jgi:transposase
MASMFSYPKAAMERAMKVQEVILRAMAEKITWWQAAEINGISDRHMRRWRDRYEKFGYRGLFDSRRGKPSPRRAAPAVLERVLALYREKYFDLNVRHFHEKLCEQHQIELSYSWVKGVLQGAGLVGRGRRRGTHHKRRARRVSLPFLPMAGKRSFPAPQFHISDPETPAGLAKGPRTAPAM